MGFTWLIYIYINSVDDVHLENPLHKDSLFLYLTWFEVSCPSFDCKTNRRLLIIILSVWTSLWNTMEHDSNTVPWGSQEGKETSDLRCQGCVPWITCYWLSVTPSPHHRPHSCTDKGPQDTGVEWTRGREGFLGGWFFFISPKVVPQLDRLFRESLVSSPFSIYIFLSK